ncbi:MAG: AtpZ/AtpI family protein, partial [Dehalococcoidia bacterium]
DASRMGTVLRLVGIGWYVALCIGGGAIGGLWLDRQLHLSPVLTLLGLGLGIALAVVGMFRMLTAVLAATSDSKDERKG